MWTEVPDKADGDVFTEAMWDTFIRDNLNSGVGLVKLAEVELSVDGYPSFTGLNQDFRDLVLVASYRDSGSASNNPLMRFNGDTGNNYDTQWCRSFGTTAQGIQDLGISGIMLGSNPSGASGSGLWGSVVVDIPLYSRSDRNKTALSRYHFKVGTSSGNMEVGILAGNWRSNSPVTQIDVSNTAGVAFESGSLFTIYGRP